MRLTEKKYSLLLILILFSLTPLKSQSLFDKVQHGYAENNGVKIHYTTIGNGPLIVMLHGYPDFWYTWRNQMEVLSKEYQVVAVDLRGYNKSDKPKGVENYRMKYLIGDVAAVIKIFPQKKAVVIGHDWGGAIAWQTAIWRPELVERLIVLSTPHPSGLFREFKNNPQQNKNSEYASRYQKEGAEKTLTAEGLAGWVKDKSAYKYYIDAFNNSDFEAMLNYYKASFPKTNQANTSNNNSAAPQFKNITCPVLGIFGLEDKALLPAGWNGTWDWVDNNLTMVSIPGAGHFVQHDAPMEVTEAIISWLGKQTKSDIYTTDTHDKIQPFDKLLGKWEIDSSYVRNRDGTWGKRTQKFKWNFYTILNGEAVQDDWISIDSTGRETKKGTNLRIFNNDENKWYMSWIDASNRKTAVFTATNSEGTVKMDGINALGRHVQNTFFNITDETFQWKQEWTFDEGKTWIAVSKFKCHKIDK